MPYYIIKISVTGLSSNERIVIVDNIWATIV